MSNIAGKAYAMNVITPVPPMMTWLQRFIFMAARAFPAKLSGLLGLSIIHFARWILIKRDQWPAGEFGKPQLNYDYMVFCSNFNGTWDQYIDAFADGIPNGLDLFWYTSIKYPASIPIASFKDYIVHNQFHTGYYYNATPGSAQRDIKGALKVYAELKALSATRAASGTTPESFAASYRKSLAKVQNCLGSPGYAPIASLDTANADANRAPFVIANTEKLAKPDAAGQGKVDGTMSGSVPRAEVKAGTSFDGGHCFLTVLLPVRTQEVVDNQGQCSSPVHMVRDQLAILATAHQSPVTEKLGVTSPFAKCLKTHFVRMAVIDNTIFNGRTASDAILDMSDRTEPRAVDELLNPYLMFCVDFDAPDGSEEELRAYLRNVWAVMRDDLCSIFAQCFGYSKVRNAEDFANFIIGYQIETTMPFNDYWAETPTLPSLSGTTMATVFLAVFAAASVVLYALLDVLGLIAGQDWSMAYRAEAAGIIVLAILSGVGTFAGLVLPRSAKAIPMALNSDLPLTAKLIAALIVLGAFMLAEGAIFYAIARQLNWTGAGDWPWLYGGEFAVILAVAASTGVYALYRLVMSHGQKRFATAPDSDLKSILKALYLQGQLIKFAIQMQGATATDLYNGFAEFLSRTQVDNSEAPRQSPGVIQ